MRSFTFKTVAHIVAGAGLSAKISEHLAQLGALERVVIITDKGIVGAGLLDAPLAALKAAGKTVLVIDDIVADPPSAMVESVATQARGFTPDCVIGFGGGSTMDTAKVVALLCASNQKLQSLYGFDQAKGPRLPLILVPTTAGTGSEVTPISVLTQVRRRACS